jgi:hypothetical protein
MKQVRQKLTLYRPATYQIKVPGEIGENWSDWAGGMTIVVESEGGDLPITTLTGVLDQTALQGLLRRLYSLGLPAISVHRVEDGQRLPVVCCPWSEAIVYLAYGHAASANQTLYPSSTA